MLKGKQLKGHYVFHYNEPKETELQEIEIIKDGAIRNFAFQGVLGTTHRDIKSRTLIFGLKGRKVKIQLEHWNDYEIEVGKRTVIESVQELTSDDIKDLGRYDHVYSQSEIFENSHRIRWNECID